MLKGWAAAGVRSWQQKHRQIEYSTNSIYLKAKKQSSLRGTFSALHRELAMKVPLKIMGLSIATFNTFSECSQHISLNLGLNINCQAKKNKNKKTVHILYSFLVKPIKVCFSLMGFFIAEVSTEVILGTGMSA